MKKVVRTAFDRVRVSQCDRDPGWNVGGAKQSFAQECDINQIIRKHDQTGLLSHVRADPGAFMDLPDQMDFQEALERVKRADEAFASLPADIRARFQNDPLFFLSFIGDPANAVEARELGLLPEVPGAERKISVDNSKKNVDTDASKEEKGKPA